MVQRERQGSVSAGATPKLTESTGGEHMASDLDTVRVLRALFNDMPRAPEGLSQEETVAWVRQSMIDYEGGDMAYMLEHVTRNAMLDIALRLREDG
ncbi:MAG: hypothetical protein C0453_20690, partial [Comamonadaceae bacterium]|nr:hypothetical protein [Comamonadaceae bacterium]